MSRRPHLHEGLHSLELLHLDVDHVLGVAGHEVAEDEAPVRAEPARHLPQNLRATRRERGGVFMEESRLLLHSARYGLPRRI